MRTLFRIRKTHQLFFFGAVFFIASLFVGVFSPSRIQALTGSCSTLICPSGSYRSPLGNNVCECVQDVRSNTSSDNAGLDLGSTYTLRDGTPVKEVFSKPADLINLIVPNLFVIGGIAVMIMVIVAGYKFISGGQKGLEDLKKILGALIAGLILMFGAYWIVQIIKMVTGADIPL